MSAPPTRGETDLLILRPYEAQIYISSPGMTPSGVSVPGGRLEFTTPIPYSRIAGYPAGRSSKIVNTVEVEFPVPVSYRYQHNPSRPWDSILELSYNWPGPPQALVRGEAETELVLKPRDPIVGVEFRISGSYSSLILHTLGGSMYTVSIPRRYYLNRFEVKPKTANVLDSGTRIISDPTGVEVKAMAYHSYFMVYVEGRRLVAEQFKP